MKRRPADEAAAWAALETKVRRVMNENPAAAPAVVVDAIREAVHDEIVRQRRDATVSFLRWAWVISGVAVAVAYTAGVLVGHVMWR